MPIITLTSDLGTKDFYLAALKGSILSNLPGVNIVDISNQVQAFDILQASFFLRNAFSFFPLGTVHLVCIESSDESSDKLLAIEYKGHFFVGPDNGLFSLMFDQDPDKVFQIKLSPNPNVLHFPLLDILMKAACHLANGGEMEVIGTRIAHIVQKIGFNPIIKPDEIIGSIIYIDRFENAITSVSRDAFEQTRKGRNFSILFKGGEYLDRISSRYEEVTPGEKLCLFGMTGNLEIAINKGKASSLLGLRLQENIRIIFKED